MLKSDIIRLQANLDAYAWQSGVIEDITLETSGHRLIVTSRTRNDKGRIRRMVTSYPLFPRAESAEL